MEFELEEATIAELQARIEKGEQTAVSLASAYLERIEHLDRRGPRLGSVIEVNPDALAIADDLDEERRSRGPRGPLHGIPILIKDNIDTGDRMMTTAGSLALLGHRAVADARVVSRLREAGAVVLGKLNLSEWANFRSTHSTSGWSARGGQCRNPYSLDRTPWGSSAGSAVAVSANLAAATLGTETDGSIVVPAAASGVVGFKPTVGLTSRAGVIPISRSQDSVGPIARTVADAALLLSVIAGPDPKDPATNAIPGGSLPDYVKALDASGLKGARIGVARSVYFGYSEKADAVVELALAAMRDEGAVIVDPADIPTAHDLTFPGSELTVLLYEFKAGLDAYLAAPGAPVRNLEEVISFNEEHAKEEMPWFGQELFLMAQAKGSLEEPEYLQAIALSRRHAREEGIDAVMLRHELDALVMPTTSPAPKIDPIAGDHIQGMGCSPAAQAGYPCISVPAGFSHGLPIGLLFTGRAFTEPTLIRLAHAFELATRFRRPPSFAESVTGDIGETEPAPLQRL
ncbi:MAG: amidase [Chloroflexi bacterium]|nr:amidase [Chloroflexota bacterium]